MGRIINSVSDDKWRHSVSMVEWVQGELRRLEERLDFTQGVVGSEQGITKSLFEVVTGMEAKWRGEIARLEVLVRDLRADMHEQCAKMSTAVRIDEGIARLRTTLLNRMRRLEESVRNPPPEWQKEVVHLKSLATPPGSSETKESDVVTPEGKRWDE